MKVKVIRMADGYLMPYSEHTVLREGMTVVEVEKAAPKKTRRAPKKKQTPAVGTYQAEGVATPASTSVVDPETGDPLNELDD